MDKLQIYKASAGAGKTFLLTEAYLKTALETPANFARILAVTFTNKAAEEMKSRILQELNTLIRTPETSPHAAEIKKHLSLHTDESLKEKALQARTHILHDYSKFQVGTIDSFVQATMKAFAFEMNLNASYNIELDTDKVATELTDKLLELSGTDKNLHQWLVRFAQFKMNQNKSWDFRKDIHQLAKEIFTENFQNKDSETPDFTREDTTKILRELFLVKNQFEKDIQHIADRFVRICKDYGCPYTGGRDKFNLIAKHFFEKIPKKDYTLTATIIKAEEGVEHWYAKSTPEATKQTIEAAFPLLRSCLQDFLNHCRKNKINYTTAQTILRNFHAFGILNDLKKMLPDYRADNNLLLISDTTFLLKKIIDDNDAPFIYEKIGNRYKHILIDEFQDTSDFQWSNFKPLITHNLAMGNYGMIVGDVKQAIYRWRNGNSRLLLKGVKEEIGTPFLEEHTLKYNWRSCPRIINFNNNFFKIAPEIIQRQINANIQEIADEHIRDTLKKEGYDQFVRDTYSDYFQKPGKPEKTAEGKIQIQFIPAANEKIYKETLQEKLPGTIEKLIQSGVKPADIGILVRKNKHAKETVELLNQYKNANPDSAPYQILSSEALTPESSPAVRILVAALQYVETPEDSLNAINFAFEYNRLTANEEISTTEIFLAKKKQKIETYIPQFLQEAAGYEPESLYLLTEKIIRELHLHKDPKHFPYIRTFQEILMEFEEKKQASLADFLTHWKESGALKNISGADNENALQVMTIHKSKGLAFEYVLIPFADWKMTGKDGLLWVKTDKPPFEKLPYIPVNTDKKLAESLFAKEQFVEETQTLIDELNMLYVAFTRAKTGLMIYTKKEKKTEGKVTSTGKLIERVIAEQTNSPDNPEESWAEFLSPDKQLFTCEEKVKTAKEKQPGADEIHEDANEILPTENVILPPAKTKKETASATESDENKKDEDLPEILTAEEYPVADFMKKIRIRQRTKESYIKKLPTAKTNRDYGIKMHRAMEYIKTEADIPFTLRTMIFQGEIEEHEYPKLQQKITEAIHLDTQTESWFSEAYTVITEAAIFTPEGNIRIPDRILESENKVIVIDFKFGKKSPAHHAQIKEYAALIKEIYRKPTEAYLYYVTQKQTEKINL